jgi:LAO/AO transport system kinase
MKFVETVVVVMAPGMGDGIQASKAGILEIGDIFLVNKSDRDGANETAKELESSLHLSAKPLGWIPLVLLGAMEKSVGITELISAINQHGEKSR